jgi:hypothetical protein
MSLPNGAEESLTLTSQLSQQKLKISAVADRRYRRKIDPLRACFIGSGDIFFSNSSGFAPFDKRKA